MSASLLAVIVVRDGALPAGADETIAEAQGNAIVVGTGAESAAAHLVGGVRITTLTTAHVRSRELAHQLVTLPVIIDAHGLILPASPDGRDLAPLLAHGLGRPLHASATSVIARQVVSVRTSGRVGRETPTALPFVATLVPGVRGVTGNDVSATVTVGQLAPELATASVTSIEVLPPDPTTMDLAEAPVIVGGGLGLGSKDRFDQLGRIGTAIGASLGGTRVASDAGWIPFTRQIGTTGVAVKPKIYLAFGVSGATQHTSGLGDPDHVISVNTDASCPMMSMSDVAIVCDAHAVLDALELRLAP